jgi:hypothetical protein
MHESDNVQREKQGERQYANREQSRTGKHKKICGETTRTDQQSFQNAKYYPRRGNVMAKYTMHSPLPQPSKFAETH